MSVRYRWKLLRAGEFRLDGGSMFGLIPRSVWTRACPSDDKGRITVQHNCLLLERDGPAPAGVARLGLLEVGTGDKLDAKSRELFAMQERTILDALHELKCDARDIGACVTTHLHFDHSGGLTRMARPGETPDWIGAASGMAGSRPDHGLKVTFPNAVVYTQAREWSDARANRSVMTRTYFTDHLEPIAERVKLMEAPLPFPPGVTPDRDQPPVGEVTRRMVDLPTLPGVGVFLCPGHTWGQQGMAFTDVKGRTVVFVPDVMPTVHHAGASYSLAYDVEPYTTMVTKRWLLSEAADRNWLLVLDHEPGTPTVRVKRNDRGWFDLVPDPDALADATS